MNQNVGASFGLSVLTVVFFAVVLYQPDRKAPLPPAGGSSVASAKPVEALPPPEPPRPAMARVSPEPPALTEPLSLAAVPAPPAPSSTGRPEAHARRDAPARAAAAVARPVSRRTARTDGPDEPRGAFTRVREGESLPDVALRVYGTARQTRSLWLANRDMVSRADAPLRAGALLRTP